MTTSRQRVVGDTYYAGQVGAADPTILWRGRRLRLLTSLRMAAGSRAADVIVTNETNRSPWGLVVLAAWLGLSGRRVLVLTEFLPGRRGPILRWFYRRTLPRACAAVQVMTERELVDYAQWYALEADQMCLIPYFSYDDRTSTPSDSPSTAGPYIMSSGRNSCDWETIVEFTNRVDLDVRLVTTAADAGRVKGASRRTVVASDIPRRDHDALLAGASVFVLALEDRPRSMGHIRLMSAVSLGVPVVATRVAGLAGYEHLAVTLVDPGDAAALASAVESLMVDPAEAQRRGEAIRRRAMAYPRSEYLRRVHSMILSGTETTPPRVLNVMHSHVDDSNPFFRLLTDHLSGAVHSHRFSWRRAMAGDLDVLHVHWPERLVRGSGRLDTLRKRCLTFALTLVLPRRRVGVVRTVHNLVPHDRPTRWETWLLNRVDRMTTTWVRMSEAQELPRSARGTPLTIPHGSYHGAYTFDPGTRPHPDRLLYFGRIRPYKGVEELLAAVEPDGRALPFHLRVVGRPTTEHLSEVLGSRVGASPSISGRLEFVSAEDLIDEIEAARAVCLPYVGMANSGALLLALTAGRPVIVPDTPVNALLAREIGESWVIRYASLDREELSRCWDVACLADGVPDLAGRSWEDLAGRYEAAYRAAVRQVGRAA